MNLKLLALTGITSFAIVSLLYNTQSNAQTVDETEVLYEYRNIDADTSYEELLSMLALEAHDESLDGIIACCEVVFNRVINSAFPDTVYEVLSEHHKDSKGKVTYQFSTWNNLSSPWAYPNEKEVEAIEKTLKGCSGLTKPMCEAQKDGKISLEVNEFDYVYFATKPHKWMHNVIKLGNHYFGTM